MRRVRAVPRGVVQFVWCGVVYASRFLGIRRGVRAYTFHPYAYTSLCANGGLLVSLQRPQHNIMSCAEGKHRRNKKANV